MAPLAAARLQGRDATTKVGNLLERRRRPGLIALSVALIAAGGLSGTILYSSSGHRTPVVVVARDVPVGTRITEADLATASIALDPAVRSVKASRAGGLVGQRAATDLKAGSLLAPSQVTDQSLIGTGEQLVGVSVRAGPRPEGWAPATAPNWWSTPTSRG